MSFLPIHKELGELTIIEVFEFFDIPRLFTCKSSTGKIFVAISVEETDKYHFWLYAPLSEERLKQLLTCDLDLLQAYTGTDEGFVYKVTTYPDSGASVERISCDKIPAEWLPLEGEKLCLPTAIIPQPVDTFEDLIPEKVRKDPMFKLSVLRETGFDAQFIANETNRETLNFLFDFSDSFPNEAPAGKLGYILSSLQELVDAIGQHCMGHESISGPIPQDILSRTEMNVAMVFQSSFGIQLRSNEPVDLFGDSIVGLSLSELLGLLEAKDNPVTLGQKLRSLRARVASKYSNFLNSVSNSGTDLICHWGSPSKDRKSSISISNAEILRVLSVVNDISEELSQEIQIRCRLIGLNVRTKKFEIESLEDGLKYDGNVDDSALPNVLHATINEEYIATLRSLTKVKTNVGEERIKRILTSLQLNLR